jgi:RHS repeat-associated protein
MWFGGFEANMSILDGDQVNAPGWSLGLPKLLGGILIEGDGSRRPARRTSVVGNGKDDVDVSYVTTDGSDITYRIELKPSATDLTLARGEVRYPDGSLTVMQGQAGHNALGGTSVLFTRLYATAMVDRHGNTTTIEYASFGSASSAARANRIVDPLGREITFHYGGSASSFRLTSITAPKLGGGERILARLTYRQILAYREIHPTDPVKDKLSSLTVVNGIFFPATGAGYWFGDADTYNMYGMITKVVEQTQMTYSPPSSAAPDGTLTAGTTIRTRSYDFPKKPSATGNRQDFPQYKTLTDSIVGQTGGMPLVTRYEVSEQGATTHITVTLPDGAQRFTTLNTATGLPILRKQDDRFHQFVSQRDYVWSLGTDHVSRLTQLTETDAFGRKKRTEYAFDTQGRAKDVKFLDWVDPAQNNNAALLRWIHYEYVDDPAYTLRGIRGLVKRTETYGPSSLLPEERTDYEYDGLPLLPAPGIERNVFATAGFRHDLLAMMPATASVRRGLLTKMLRWIAPQTPGNAATIATEMKYTVAGGLAEVKVGGRTRYSIGYSPVSRYALPDSITMGAFVSKGASTTARSQYKWDVGTGRLVSRQEPSRGVVSFGYDAAMRVVRVSDPRAPEARRSFAPTGLTYTDTTHTIGGTVLATAITDVDGLGRPRKIVDTPASSPTTEVYLGYDTRGRPSSFSRVLTSGGGSLEIILSYDGAGRVISADMPDGKSVSTASYDRAGMPDAVLPTGTLRRESDPWGRSRYIVTDALGRTVQVLEPRGTPPGWTNTRYEYDARSNLLSIYSDANQAGTAVAGRRFQYDGLSRLTHRYLIERAPALDAAGTLASGGLWSDVYRYNEQSQLAQHVDPRGVLVSYDYGTDPLGRLFSIRVTQPTPIGPVTIGAVPDTRFSYMRSGDPMRLRSVQSVGLYKEMYRYDPKSRLDEIITTFDERPNSPVRQRVTRDAKGRVNLFAVGTPIEPEVQLRYTPDASGRDVAVSGSSANGVGWSVTASFDAAATLTQLLYKQAGWGATETLTVAHALGRLSRQQLVIAGKSVLDQTYSYAYNEMFDDEQAANQLIGIKDNISGAEAEYGYDALSRLVRVAIGQQLGRQYKYDPAGNRISARTVEYGPSPPQHQGEERTYPPDHTSPSIDLGDAAADGQGSLIVDRLTNRIAEPGFAYDAAGNTVRLPRKDGNALILQYDGLGRLVKVTREGTTDAEIYRYSHDNRIVLIRRADHSIRYSVWRSATSSTQFEASSLAAVMRHAETPITLRGRTVGRVIGPAISATVEFRHETPNGLLATAPGSSVPVRSSNMQNTSSYGFDWSSTGNTSLTPRYHSYGRSRFGLDYAVNRFYDPETGRFLQSDPLGHRVYRAEDPQSLNLYAFLRADPMNRRDPLGLANSTNPSVCKTEESTCGGSSGVTLVAPEVTVVAPLETITGGKGLLPDSSDRDPSMSSVENPGGRGGGGGGHDSSAYPVAAAATWVNSKTARIALNVLRLITQSAPLPDKPPVVTPVPPLTGPSPPTLPSVLKEILDKWKLPGPVIFVFPPSWINPDPCSGRFGCMQ